MSHTLVSYSRYLVIHSDDFQNNKEVQTIITAIVNSVRKGLRYELLKDILTDY